MRSLPNILCLTLAALAPWSQSQALAEEEIDVGASAAGQLKVDLEIDQPFELPVSIYAGISGYATGEVGFHSTILDDPTNDFFQVSFDGDFRFVLLAKDPGMEIWRDGLAGYMDIGEQHYLGPAVFDNHPVLNITDGTPGNVYSLTLKMIDLNGIHSDSAPFILSFTPQPGFGPFGIHITRVNPRHVTLTWPTDALGWALESSGTMEVADWNTVTNAVGTVGTNFSLTMATTEAQQFFRLRRQ